MEGRQVGEGQPKRLPQIYGPTILAECTRPLNIAHIGVHDGGGGVETLCAVQHIPHKQTPREGGLVRGVRAERHTLVVGDGVGGRVVKATNLG